MSRVTAVPAQITTVEDKIIGSLGMKQLVMIGTALLGSGAVFLWVAPCNKISLLKGAFLLVANLLLCSGAFRYKDELLSYWAFVGLQYVLRPRYWIYDKNSGYLRPPVVQREQVAEVTEELKAKEMLYDPIPNIDTPTRVRLEGLMRNPAANVRYINTRGGLKIVFTESD